MLLWICDNWFISQSQYYQKINVLTVNVETKARKVIGHETKDQNLGEKTAKLAVNLSNVYTHRSNLSKEKKLPWAKKCWQIYQTQIIPVPVPFCSPLGLPTVKWQVHLEWGMRIAPSSPLPPRKLGVGGCTHHYGLLQVKSLLIMSLGYDVDRLINPQTRILSFGL